MITIYDTDDLLFDKGGIKHFSKPDSIQAYQSMMKACDVVLVSTRYLQNKASAFHNDVRVMKNGLSFDLLDKASNFHSHQKNKNNIYITISYLSGSKHHDHDFEIVAPVLYKILQDFPNVRLLLMGKLQYPAKFTKFGERFTYKEFVPYKDFWRVFEEIDINIVPLDISDPFAQARSEIKYMEAGLFGIPTIASPTQTYREAIDHNVNGLLAQDGEWYESLKTLVTDKQKREQIGEAARKDVLANYSPEVRMTEWDHLLKDIVHQYGNKKKANRFQVGVDYAGVVLFWLWRRLKIAKRNMSF